MAGNGFGGQAVGTNYRGNNAQQPPNWNYEERNPTPYDSINYVIGDLWLNTVTRQVWVLVSLQGTSTSKGELADWREWGDAGGLETLTGDTGGAVSPDGANNINTLGTAGEILVTGNPGTNTLTWSLDGSVATSYPTDAGTAIPAAGVLNVLGGTAGRDINTKGAGNTIHVDLNNTISIGDLSVLAAGVNALTVTTGDISMPAGQHSATTNQKIKMAGGDISFFLNNVFLGIQSGNTTMTPGAAIFNVGIGPASLQSLTTGTSNNCVGNGTGQLITTGTNNNYFGYVCGISNVTGIENCGFGDGALASGTASYNSAFGDGALQALTTGTHNSAFGNQAGGSYTTSDSYNVAMADPGRSGESYAIRIGGGIANSGAGNIFIGDGSGNATYTVVSALFNVGVGGGCFSALTTGLQNTAVGHGALQKLTTGTNNACFGLTAGNNITTGANNTIISGGVQVTTGNNNVIIGEFAGNAAGGSPGVTTGSYNCLIGETAGTAYTSSESSNIMIGSAAGTVGESNKCRIGSGTGAGNGQINKTFIHGIRGITTDAADAIAVLISSTGQLGTVSSSIRFKENVNDMGDASSPMMSLRPVVFDYKESSAHSYGLIAEEVAEIFPDLVAHNAEGEIETVKYHLMTTMLLNEIQKLAKRIELLENR